MSYGLGPGPEIESATHHISEEPQGKQGNWGDLQESGRGARIWVTEPNKTRLRGPWVSGDMNSGTQDLESRDMRRDVHRLAGIGYTEAWNDWKLKGKPKE